MLINPIKARENGANKARRNTIAIVSTAAAAAATTLILAKKGKLNPTEGGNKAIEAIKAALKGPADKALDIITGSKVFANVAEKVGKVKTEIDPIIESATKKAGKIKEGIIADVETIAANAEGSIKGFTQKAPTYAQEARCKLSGLAGEANEIVQKAGKAVSGLTEKAPVKKAIAFAKDIPTYIGCIALDVKDKVVKFLPKAQKEISEEVQKKNLASDLANALRKAAEKAQ